MPSKNLIFTAVWTPIPSSHSKSSGGGGFSISTTQAAPRSPLPESAQSVVPSSPTVAPEGKIVFPEDELFNESIEEGYCYVRRPYQGIIPSTVLQTSLEFQKALSFMWSYEMTMYDSVDGFAPLRNLTRQEAAKIFSQFAMNVLCRTPNKNLHTNYTDTANADESLKPYIELAYQLGLMHGN